MKTTVRNMMMSLVLVGGMILAVPASAQFSSSRQRPSAARGASVSTQSRSSESRQSMSRSSESRQSMSRSSESRHTRSESRPQVSRSTGSERQSQMSRSTSAEHRQATTRSSQGSMRSRGSDASRMTSAPQSARTAQPQVQSRTATERTRTGASVAPGRSGHDNGSVNPGTRGGTGRGTVGTIRSGRERPSTQFSGGNGIRTTQPSVTPSNIDNNGRGNGRGGNGRGGNGGVNQGDNKGGHGHDRDGMGNDRNGNGRDNGNGRGRGSDRNGHGHDNGHGYDNDNHHGYGPRDRGGHSRPYNYDSHPHRDHFSYAHAHHNWSRPLPPPPRPYRPAPIRYYRPVIPAHYRPYYGAPVIDRILGITFGTYFDVSLDYLYTSGYYIDGYQDNIVYLRDVRMLNLLWPDVMLSYDAGRLANAQFVFATTYRDRSRYNRIYHDLSAVYGPPISVESGMATWFGGNTTGYVTLSIGSDYGRYYTTLSIGY